MTDYVSLPTALLPIAKVQMRVDFPEDDDFIILCLSRAIDLLEKKWGFAVFGTSLADWQPVPAGLSVYQCPVQPVSAFIVMSGGIDVSAEYALFSASLTSPWFLRHSDQTPFPADALVTLTAGYATSDTMPPAALDNILRLASTLYEFREFVGVTSLNEVPQWRDDELVGLWVPRA